MITIPDSLITIAGLRIEEGAGWVVRFVSPDLAFLKVVGFVGLQVSILFLLGSLAVFLARPAPGRGARESGPPEEG